MRIIHVITSLSKGGAERVAAELANKAAEDGNEVFIIAGWKEDPELLQTQLDPHIKVEFVADTRKNAFLTFPFWILKKRKFLLKADIIHCHLTFSAVFSSFLKVMQILLIGRSKRPAIIETYHAVGMNIPKGNRWFHSVMLKQRNGIAFMAMDKYWDNFSSRNPDLKIKIIPNGISVNLPVVNEQVRRDFLNTASVKQGCKYIIGTIGMLRPDRKPWLYIPIFRKIYQMLGDKVHFVIGGDGSEMEHVKSLIKENGLSEKVYLPGLVNNPPGLISMFDIYVSLSVGETTGISMLEAAMCSVPVIGIQLRDDYEPKPGDWVWSDKDPDKIADKIIGLLGSNNEYLKIKEMQNTYVNRQFSSNAMYSVYKSFYEEVLSDR